jgi:hypothetical protein
VRRDKKIREKKAMQLVNENDFRGKVYLPSELPKAKFRLGSEAPNYFRAMVYDVDENVLACTIGQQIIKDFMSKLIINQKGANMDNEVQQTFPYNEMEHLEQYMSSQQKKEFNVRMEFAFTFPSKSPPVVIKTPEFKVRK